LVPWLQQQLPQPEQRVLRGLLQEGQAVEALLGR
jgi:hypothetical protein